MNKTKIEWADATWNPITGCTKISPGCQNCYAERMAKRLAGRCGYPADEPFKVTLHPDRLDQPLKWKKPRTVLVSFMGDLFHEDAPDKYIIDCLSIMAEAWQHTFIILTKRPARMKDIIAHETVANDVWLQTSRGVNAEPSPWPLPNIWLGVTAENQEQADKRIPILLQIPAVVRFVSVEPMLGPVDLTQIDIGGNVWINSLTGDCKSYHPYGGMWKITESKNKLDWVICGGETGPGARPMHPDWVRGLRDQCQASGTPFFFKQHGEWSHDSQDAQKEDATRVHIWPDGSYSWKVGKKKAGRLLDGREWSEFPL
jgi:protein gp37